ncbi:hypothetical protein DFO77_1562 [Marinilabilia salmonicolor]|uniref:Uncharacterized protein n=1 Tax=Marinilabilia salmonicolor TaxID=989 RepID=A0A368UKL3_9BACT|nr:hypothetical protein DFO77_1562 [Marinilabilia salmonicolor]
MKMLHCFYLAKLLIFFENVNKLLFRMGKRPYILYLRYQKIKD